MTAACKPVQGNGGHPASAGLSLLIALFFWSASAFALGASGPNSADVGAGTIYQMDLALNLAPNSWTAFYGLATPTGAAVQSSTTISALPSGPAIQTAGLSVPPRVNRIDVLYAPPCLTTSDWLFISDAQAVHWGALVPAQMDWLNGAGLIEPGSLEDAGRFFNPDGALSMAGNYYGRIPWIKIATSPGKPPFTEYALWDPVGKNAVFAVPLVYPAVIGFDGTPVNYEAFLLRGPTYRFFSHPGLCLPTFQPPSPYRAPTPYTPPPTAANPPADVPKTQPVVPAKPDAAKAPLPKGDLPKAPDAPKDAPAQPKPANPADANAPKADAPASKDAPIAHADTPAAKSDTQSPAVADAAPADASSPDSAVDQAVEPDAPPAPPLVPPLVVPALEPEPVIAPGQVAQVSGIQSPQAAVSAQVTTHQTVLDTVVTFDTPGEHTLVVDYPFPAEYFSQGIVSLNLERSQDAGHAIHAAPRSFLSFDSAPVSNYRLEKSGNATRVVWLVNAQVGEMITAKATVHRALTPERIKMTQVHQFAGDQTAKLFPTPKPPARLKVRVQAATAERTFWPLGLVAITLMLASWAVWKKPWITDYLAPGRWQYLYYYFNRKRRRAR